MSNLCVTSEYFNPSITLSVNRFFKEVAFGDSIEIIDNINHWVVYLGWAQDMGREIANMLNEGPSEPMVIHITNDSLRSGEAIVEPLLNLIVGKKFRINNSRDRKELPTSEADIRLNVRNQINELDSSFKSYLHNSEHFVNKIRSKKSYSKRSENVIEGVGIASTVLAIIGIAASIFRPR
uniref:Retinoic acid receptor responder protein 3like [Oreochromis niloticus] n=1 Tax=Lepeophtheirus salmonis TaxID=72036 RepID=A0A0K2UQQ8_LEPSM